MPAHAIYARESDGKDTLKCVNFNALRVIFYLKIKKIVSLLCKRLTLLI